MNAYPSIEYTESVESNIYAQHAGMTLRQRYAMAAMQGFCSHGWITPEMITEHSFKVADTMLAYEGIQND